MSAGGRRQARRRRLGGTLAGTVVLALAACGSGDPAPADTSSPTGSSAGPSSSPSPPPTCTEQTLAELDLRQRVGQLLLVGVPVADPVAGFAQLSGVPVGGVFLQGRSSAGVAALAAAVAQVQAAAELPLQIAVDQEGGHVQTLRGPGFDDLPTAVEQGRLPADALRSDVGRWAAQLRDAGITLDLAPVADTVPAGTEGGNPSIGANDRQYGSDPAQVAATVTTVVTALQDAGVAAAAKHFPGLGRVPVDTDTASGGVDPETTHTDPFLAPFAAAVEAGTAAVMVSSASYPQLDPNRVAVFSAPVIDLLRNDLGFDGVVVSDDLATEAVAGTPVERRAVEAVTAGVDVLLTVETADARPLAGSLVEQATVDPAFAARVSESARRVLALKERFGLLTC
ncbi:MAG TPA: glycoside hydrolase family 3 N-terminal domain-containing protein [Modestobacter sp.]|jgi:beta-N-acetylhexosaminidase|nr:glycoside hydrolase family 3 N-terminal domain-containing protein [Modestobacter sp.]